MSDDNNEVPKFAGSMLQRLEASAQKERDNSRVGENGEKLAASLAKYDHFIPKVHSKQRGFNSSDVRSCINYGVTTQFELYKYMHSPNSGLLPSMQEASQLRYETDTSSDAFIVTFSQIREMWLQDPFGTLQFDLTDPTMWNTRTKKQAQKYATAVAKREAEIKELPLHLESFNEYRSTDGLKKSALRVQKQLPDPIDPYEYVDLDNGNNWHKMQISIRNLQNDLYFRTLQYLPRMMNKVTKRMFQAEMRAWYDEHNCHGEDRVKHRTRMPMWNVYRILMRLCVPTTDAELYFNLTNLLRRKHDNVLEYYKELDLKVNIIMRYSTHSHEPIQMSSMLRKRLQKANVHVDKEMQNRMWKSIKRAAVVHFVQQLTSDERTSIIRYFVTETQKGSDTRLSYNPDETPLLKYSTSTFLYPLKEDAVKKVDRLLPNKKLFELHDTKSRLFFRSWNDLGVAAANICVGDTHKNPRNVNRRSMYWTQASKSKMSTLAIEEIRKLHEKNNDLVRQLGQKRKGTPGPGKGPGAKKPKIGKPGGGNNPQGSKRNSFKSKLDKFARMHRPIICSHCCRDGLGKQPHDSGKCDPEQRVRKRNSARKAGTLFSAYCVDSRGTKIGSDGATYKELKSKSSSQRGDKSVPNIKWICPHCSQLDRETRHPKGAKCVSKLLIDKGIKNVKVQNQHFTNFGIMSKRYKDRNELWRQFTATVFAVEKIPRSLRFKSDPESADDEP